MKLSQYGINLTLLLLLIIYTLKGTVQTVSDCMSRARLLSCSNMGTLSGSGRTVVYQEGSDS